MDWVPSACALPQGRICSPGVCPSGDSHPEPFGYGTTLQPAGPHWPGLLTSVGCAPYGTARSHPGTGLPGLWEDWVD